LGDATCHAWVAATALPQQQLLPFNELDWDNFERLCYRLASASSDIESWAVLYGARGQKQDGIDIYARRPNTSMYSCWQSKRYKKLSAATLKSAIAEFEKGPWAAKSCEFVICTSASIQDRKLQDEIEVQRTRLRKTNIELIVRGKTELSTILKTNSKLVRDFFGKGWVADFCIDDDREHSANTLDAFDVATLRAELRRHYESNFAAVDPGVGGQNVMHHVNSTFLPLLSRFVEPDVEVTTVNYTGESTGRENQIAVIESDLAPPKSPRSIEAPVRTSTRRQLSQWVSEGDHSVIAADAGLGKSTLLRAFALDLLLNGEHFPSVAQRWPSYVPIVLPFSFWVRQFESCDDVSLSKVVRIWFHQFQVSDQLLHLIDLSLSERRGLLLIDGLDEWSNEAAARSTLTLLETYVQNHRAPAILTGRPSGLARLGSLNPNWRQTKLAPLSAHQQRTLATTWFRHLNPPSGENSKQRLESETKQVKARVDAFFSDMGQSGNLLPLSGVPLLLAGLISLFVQNVTLPRSRFQAYEELIKLLSETHPNRRAQASLDRQSRFGALSDTSLRLDALGNFAYRKREQGLDSGIPTGLARKIATAYLQDQDGPGLLPPDASAGAKSLFDVTSESAGLIVEKAPGQIGFVHAVFEEALAGRYLATRSFSDQEAFVKQNAGNPRWTTSILMLLHSLTRGSEIDQLLRGIATNDLGNSTSVVRHALVAEVIFGEFKCSARIVNELAPTYFRMVEEDTWPPLREAVLKQILESCARGHPRDVAGKSLADWYPCPLRFMSNIYPLLKAWPKESAKELLCLGLFNEDPASKVAAATTIAEIFSGDIDMGEWLLQVGRSSYDPDTLYAACEALLHGWWSDARTKHLLNDARNSTYHRIRLVGIRARIKSGTHDKSDLDEVLDQAARYGSSFSEDSATIANTLLVDPMYEGGSANNAK